MSLGAVSATKGVLLRLREQLKFIQKGKEILEMKRDHIAGELNKHLAELRLISELDKKLLEAYASLLDAYSLKGYENLASSTAHVVKPSLRVAALGVMGIPLPHITVEKGTEFSRVTDPTAYEVARKFADAFDHLVKAGLAEAKIRVLANELMLTNRKVNALEKVVIPSFQRLIYYIEEKLLEEELEEFAKTKHIRDVVRRRR